MLEHVFKCFLIPNINKRALLRNSLFFTNVKDFASKGLQIAQPPNTGNGASEDQECSRICNLQLAAPQNSGALISSRNRLSYPAMVPKWSRGGSFFLSNGVTSIDMGRFWTPLAPQEGPGTPQDSPKRPKRSNKTTFGDKINPKSLKHNRDKRRQLRDRGQDRQDRTVSTSHLGPKDIPRHPSSTQARRNARSD